MEQKFLTSKDVLAKMHLSINLKFNRKKTTDKIDPIRLKSFLTLHYVSRMFADYEPECILPLLKELISNKSVQTNIGDQSIHPFDAYFVPTTEL